MVEKEILILSIIMTASTVVIALPILLSNLSKFFVIIHNFSKKYLTLFLKRRKEKYLWNLVRNLPGCNYTFKEYENSQEYEILHKNKLRKNHNV